MSERKINLEEILTTKFPHLKGYMYWEPLETYVDKHRHIEIEDIYELMKEACRQTLELAAENAKAEQDLSALSRTKGVIYVNKQSILNTINQIE